jgi:hypothetical protein
MQVPLVRFGSIDAEGQEHENDIVIGGGHVRSTPRRRASSSTSGMIGSEPLAPVP